MSNISMYVMAHKKFDAPKNEIYKPMQVGAALHEDLGYLRDDAGDNISVKNPNYSELTGIYWAWKNDHDSDIVGICHYRRFFADDDHNLMNGDFIESVFEKADVVTTYPAKLKNSLFVDYCLAHKAEDIIETRNVIKRLYPDYLDTYDEVMNGEKMFFANMMIARKSVFDEYCKWLFDILFEVEKNVDISGHDEYNKRVFGFISERLLGVWLQKNRLKIHIAYVIMMGDKAETTELVRWGVDRINAGEFEKLTETFDERRKQYANLFQEGSDERGYLNMLYDMAGRAAAGGGRSAILGYAAEKYIIKNYYLEYAGCMFDIIKNLKPRNILLGSERALYGTSLGGMADMAPLSMPAQDLFYDLKMFEKAVDLSDKGGLKTCILEAWDGMLYEKCENLPAGPGIKELAFDVLFAEEGAETKKTPWDIVPEDLLRREEKNAVEAACRNIALQKGGFFNDMNPRGKNLSLPDASTIDIKKENTETQKIFDENKKLLTEIAGRCESENMRFVVVVPPYRKTIDKEGSSGSDSYEKAENDIRAVLRQDLLSVLEDLPYPVEYQDLNSEIWDGIFTDEDFFDNELLNENGAAKFTQIINELCSLEQ